MKERVQLIKKLRDGGLSDEQICALLHFSKEEFMKTVGDETGENKCIAHAFRPLKELYGAASRRILRISIPSVLKAPRGNNLENIQLK